MTLARAHSRNTVPLMQCNFLFEHSPSGGNYALFVFKIHNQFSAFHKIQGDKKNQFSSLTQTPSA